MYLFPTPLSFPANCKKPIFEILEKDKRVISDISWPLTSFIFFFCAAFWNRLIALMKLFSLGRTVFAVAAKFPSPVALVKWQKDDDNAAHVRNGMVPGRSPETVYSRIASRPGDDWSPPRFVFFTFIHHFSNSPYHDITELLHISASVDFIHFLSFLHKHPPGSLFLPPNCTNYCQQSTRISKSWIYPTAHPVFISPATFYPKCNQSRQKTSFLVFD